MGIVKPELQIEGQGSIGDEQWAEGEMRVEVELQTGGVVDRA